MAYYDRIAKQWHDVTGYAGGAFKELVLNDVLLQQIPGIEGRSLLELGTGNGYFLPLVFRRFSGQVPKVVVITDQSETLLSIARKRFSVPMAAYQVLDVRGDLGRVVILDVVHPDVHRAWFCTLRDGEAARQTDSHDTRPCAIPSHRMDVDAKVTARVTSGYFQAMRLPAKLMQAAGLLAFSS